MKQSTKVLSLLILFTLVCVSFSYAADPPKNTGYDKYGKPLPGTQTTIQTGPPVVKATGPTPTTEGDRPFQQQVTVDVPRTVCRDFQDYKNEGDPIASIRRSAGYSCPPGYFCHLTSNDLRTYNCIKSYNREIIYADDSRCSWDTCTGY